MLLKIVSPCGITGTLYGVQDDGTQGLPIPQVYDIHEGSSESAIRMGAAVKPTDDEVKAYQDAQKPAEAAPADKKSK